MKSPQGMATRNLEAAEPAEKRKLGFLVGGGRKENGPGLGCQLFCNVPEPGPLLLELVCTYKNHPELTVQGEWSQEWRTGSQDSLWAYQQTQS